MASLGNLLVTGAARFVNTIRGSITHAQNGMYYGTCSTAAGTAAKVVELVDPTGFELKPGVMIAVKFSATNTASSCTLNVEGTGAKQIWYAGSVYTSTSNSVNGIANRIHTYVYNGTYWVWMGHGSEDNSNTYPSAQCETAAATAAKTATCTNYTLWPYTYLHINIRYTNTAASALTLNVNSQGAKPIYINGTASSSSNYTLHAGTYIVLYNGTYWDFRTNGDPSCNSTMLYEDTLWNGVQLRIWASNRVVTAVFSGSESAATSGGSVAAYAQLDSYYAPRSQIKKISPDQNGKRFITLADTYGKVGIYWQLDTTTSTAEFYDVITWSY